MSVNHQKSPTPTSHQVNNLLHTLRGEQFRHAQNIRKSRTHISSALTHNSPTLPRGLIDPNRLTYDTKADAVAQKSASPCPGPGPPRSWILTKMKDVHDTPRWRARALALCTSHSWQESDPEARQPIPALSILCFQILLATSSTEFAEYIVPYIPPHLRRDLVRYTAVHTPLPNSKLWPLYQPDGHADGEIIVVGPSSTLRDDYFITNSHSSHIHPDDELKDWDSDDSTPTPLHTFIVLSTHLASSTLLTLPPTITHLGLINLPTGVSLHRLPGLCPLVVVLDLSHNRWLGSASSEAQKILDRIDWTRWSSLRTLGFRDCYIPSGMRAKLNKGRWDDIEIVQ